MTQSDLTPSQTPQGGSLREIMPAIGLLAAGLTALGIGTWASETVPGQYVVVTPPGLSSKEVLSLVAGAGGALIGSGGFNNILFAASESSAFAATLEAAGAWMVLPAPAFLGCTPVRLEI